MGSRGKNLDFLTDFHSFEARRTCIIYALKGAKPPKNLEFQLIFMHFLHSLRNISIKFPCLVNPRGGPAPPGPPGVVGPELI